MSLEVRNTRDLATNPYLSILLYGPPKVGKTYFLSTVENILIISCEPGLATLRETSVDYVTPERWEDINPLYVELLKDAKPGVVKYKGKEYNAIGIDPLNEFYALPLRSAMSIAQGKLSSSRETAAEGDYGLARTRLSNIMKLFVKLPVHVIFTCIEAAVVDKETSVLWMGPNLPGKLFNEVPAFVDFWWHMQTREVREKEGVRTVYEVLTKTEGLFKAGGREGLTKKLDRLEPADFKTIYNKLTKGVLTAPVGA